LGYLKLQHGKLQRVSVKWADLTGLQQWIARRKLPVEFASLSIRQRDYWAERYFGFIGQPNVNSDMLAARRHLRRKRVWFRII